MKILLITNGKVSGELSGGTLNEVSANNPNIEAVEDTFGLFKTIGMDYADGVLSGEPLPEPEPPEPPPLPRLISVGAFFDRFGAQKYPILASDNPGVKALIQDCAVRKFIDLDNPALPYGLDMLVAAGFAVEPNDIISAAITNIERP